MAIILRKGSYVTAQKLETIIRLFSQDLNATQIAHVAQLSRITINAYLKQIRTEIALYCLHGYQPAPASASLPPSTARFGMYKSGELILLNPVHLLPGDPFPAHCSAIADFEKWKLIRPPAFSDDKGRPLMDEISGFWGLTKNRLQQFRGLQRSTLLLHVKESEFRYNLRHTSMEEILMNVLLA
jgi:hypothetical protein